MVLLLLLHVGKVAAIHGLLWAILRELLLLMLHVWVHAARLMSVLRREALLLVHVRLVGHLWMLWRLSRCLLVVAGHV